MRRRLILLASQVVNVTYANAPSCDVKPSSIDLAAVDACTLLSPRDCLTDTQSAGRNCALCASIGLCYTIDGPLADIADVCEEKTPPAQCGDDCENQPNRLFPIVSNVAGALLRLDHGDRRHRIDFHYDAKEQTLLFKGLFFSDPVNGMKHISWAEPAFAENNASVFLKGKSTEVTKTVNEAFGLPLRWDSVVSSCRRHAGQDAGRTSFDPDITASVVRARLLRAPSSDELALTLDTDDTPTNLALETFACARGEVASSFEPVSSPCKAGTASSFPVDCFNSACPSPTCVWTALTSGKRARCSGDGSRILVCNADGSAVTHPTRGNACPANSVCTPSSSSSPSTSLDDGEADAACKVADTVDVSKTVTPLNLADIFSSSSRRRRRRQVSSPSASAWSASSSAVHEVRVFYPTVESGARVVVRACITDVCSSAPPTGEFGDDALLWLCR